MSSHILIFGGFITSLLDDMHVILGHIPYPPRSAGICLFVHTIVIERMSHDIFGISSCFDRCHTGAYPLSFGIIWTWLVCPDSSYQEYEPLLLHFLTSSCYVRCHTRAYPSNFAFTIFRSDIQTSSSKYQAFRLRLHMDQMFRLHLHHIQM